MDRVQRFITGNRGYDWIPSNNFKDERLHNSGIGLHIALGLMDYKDEKIDETDVRLTNYFLSLSIQHNDKMERDIMESVKDADDFNKLFPSGKSRPCIGYPIGEIGMSQLKHKETYR